MRDIRGGERGAISIMEYASNTATASRDIFVFVFVFLSPYWNIQWSHFSKNKEKTRENQNNVYGKIPHSNGIFE